MKSDKLVLEMPIVPLSFLKTTITVNLPSYKYTWNKNKNPDNSYVTTTNKKKYNTNVEKYLYQLKLVYRLEIFHKHLDQGAGM